MLKNVCNDDRLERNTCELIPILMVPPLKIAIQYSSEPQDVVPISVLTGHFMDYNIYSSAFILSSSMPSLTKLQFSPM